MSRRRLGQLGLLGAAWMFAPGCDLPFTRAPTPARTPMIGTLAGGSPENNPNAEAFQAGLRELGYDLDRNLLTGLTAGAAELNPKRLQLLKEAFPAASRIAILGEGNLPGAPALSAALRGIETAASSLGVQVWLVNLGVEPDREAALANIAAAGGDAVIVLPNATRSGGSASLIS